MRRRAQATAGFALRARGGSRGTRARGRVRVRGSRRALCAVLFSAITVSGCTLLGPDFKLPFISIPKSYPERDVGASPPIAVPANWWLLYGDPTLDKLVAAGLQNNADVRRAIARIEEAEAFMREVSAASLLPQIDGNAAAGRS